MNMEGERDRFIRAHEKEIATVVDSATAEKLDAGVQLSDEQEGKILERFETKVFTWKRPLAAPGSKSLLLEAAEPAAYKTIRPLIERLQADERCGKIVLVTDNISGKRFEEEQESFQFEQIRNPDQPVMTDIPGDIDVTLALVEPSDSPEKVLLYAGKSIYGSETAKTYLFIDGFIGGTTRKLLTDESAAHMDSIDAIFVANDAARRLFESAVPETKGRVVVIGSLVLESLRQTLPGKEALQEERRLLREKLAIPQDAVAVLYAGFPSSDYERLAGQSTTGDVQKHELTLNQETFKQTLSAVAAAAAEDPGREYALIIRTHPRAHGEDNVLEIPEDLPQNMRVVWANSPEYAYEDITNAVADIVACQSTSTEVFLAPYRGCTTAVFDYAGVQERINENIFGAEGVAALKESEGVFLASSEQSLADYVRHFQGRPERMPFPEDPIPNLMDKLLGEERPK